MAEKRFAKNVLIISMVSIVLALFIYIFVDHHRDTPNRILQDRRALLSSGSGAAERMKPVGQINVASTEMKRVPLQIAAAAPFNVNGQQVFQNTCVACHGAGIAGAPKVGDTGQWAKRVAKGLDILYASAINGLQGSGGVMPAKGGNQALSGAEVRAAVDYMVKQLK
ncbi:MAG: c-type cytochrome [Acidiferrobacterales bacterium]